MSVVSCRVREAERNAPFARTRMSKLLAGCRVREAERNAPVAEEFDNGVFRCRCTHPTGL